MDVLTTQQMAIVDAMKDNTPIAKEDFSRITLAMMDEWVKRKWRETEDPAEKDKLKIWWRELAKGEFKDPKEPGKIRRRTTVEIKRALCEKYGMMPTKKDYRANLGEW